MCYAGATVFVAALRGVGLDARVCSEAGPNAWDRARRYTNGDECFPQRVVLADFLESLERHRIAPAQAAVFLTTGDGPCRFGQYAPYLSRTLRRMGLGEAQVLAPNSDNGYREVQGHAADLKRTLWWAVVAADALRRLLHQTRPYELAAGTTEEAFAACLADVCAVLEDPDARLRDRLDGVVAALARSRDRFRGVRVREKGTRPLIGVVGEIFCRLNTYSNEDVVRKIETLGGEAWVSGISEWVWYSNAEELAALRRKGQSISRRALCARLTSLFQGWDERRLLAPLAGEFSGWEDPHDVRELLELARPYLPWEGTIGEMVLSVGKAIWLWRKGADGIVDVSPFGCMNGVVSEAVYPEVSRDHGGVPIRSFYVDQATSPLEEGLELFLQLAQSYRRRRTARTAVRSGEPVARAFGGREWKEMSSGPTG